MSPALEADPHGACLPDLNLGPFSLERPIGKGAMGEVWRATDTALSREVAVKVLPAEMAADPERLERFKREAQAIAALNHPNIVPIFDVGRVQT